jgi:energy-converting hydrogenase Eha subunit E
MSVGIFISRDCYNAQLRYTTTLTSVETCALVKINCNTEINVTKEMPAGVSLMMLVFQELCIMNCFIFSGAFVKLVLHINTSMRTQSQNVL